MTTKPQAWTKEPWIAKKEGPDVCIKMEPYYIATLHTDCHCPDEESPDPIEHNAARIVACVNAMDGIADPAEWRRKVEALIASAAYGKEEWYRGAGADDWMRDVVTSLDALTEKEKR